jgi:hypothetical protein
MALIATGDADPRSSTFCSAVIKSNAAKNVAVSRYFHREREMFRVKRAPVGQQLRQLWPE